MKNCDYLRAKQDIESGKPVSEDTLKQLRELRDEFQQGVNECTIAGNVGKAMYFNETKMQINNLLHMAAHHLTERRSEHG